MATKPATQNAAHKPTNDPPGLGPKKTLFVLVTVVGCIAILWPKIFYPMMFSTPNEPVKDAYINKDLKPGAGRCCGVVLDQEKFANVSIADGQAGYRKQLNPFTGELSLRQERPPHLRPGNIHPAMIERGRAIPNTPSVPIVTEKPHRAPDAPQIIEGRPGPIPGMRPPMGAGSNHQATQKGSSMGLIMPLYTIGIVAFFVYTIMKLVVKKPENATPYPPPIKTDSTFKQEVFRSGGADKNNANFGWKEHDTSLHTNGLNNLLHRIVGPNQHHSTLNNNVASNGLSDSTSLEYHLRETEQLLEITLLKKKLRETERAMEQIIADMGVDKATDEPNEIGIDMKTTKMKKAEMEQVTTQDANVEPNITNGHIKSVDAQDKNEPLHEHHNDEKTTTNEFIKIEQHSDRKKRDTSADRSLQVLGLEMTASCEGGHKWGRSPAPTLNSSFAHHAPNEPETVPQSIYLEGALPHESQILIADAETTSEGVYSEEVNGNADEPAVILSSKMTLSLINLDPVNSNGNAGSDNDEDIDEAVEDDDEELEQDDDEIQDLHGDGIAEKKS